MTAPSGQRRAEDAIEHSDLTDKTYERLRQRILSGRYAIGERLQITALAQQLGVSHTPVKIAFNRLVTEGIVESVPRRGMFVTRPSRKDMEEVQDVRLLIETHAITTAVSVVNLDQLADLRTELNRFAERVDRIPYNGWNIEKAAEMNQSFHEKIVAMVGNDKLLEVWRGLQIQQQLVRFNSLAQVSPETVLAQHRAILDALEARDIEAAARAMATHITFNKARFADAVEQLNDGSQSLTSNRFSRSLNANRYSNVTW